MKLNNMRIGKRLFMAFTIILFLMGVFGTVVFLGIQNLSSTIINTLDSDARLSEYSSRLRANVHAMRQYEKDMIINMNSIEKVEKYFKQWNKQYKGGEEKLILSQKIVYDNADKELIKKMLDSLGRYKGGIINVYESIGNSAIKTTVEGNEKLKKYKEDIHFLQKNSKIFSYKYIAKVHAIKTVVSNQSSLIKIVIGIVIVVSIFISIIVGIFITRSITKPLGYAVSLAEFVADGDFTQIVKDEYIKRNDEIGDLSGAFKKMIDSLRDVISNVITSTENLSQVVQEIAAGNENLSQRTSEQASSLEEIASTIEESTSTINANADNTKEAKTISDKSAIMAREGNAVVKETVEAINSVSVLSNKMGDIIGVINDISFQTNLLALNAAVEAARAGEQGRGFAVVAGEVRNLAQRSAASAGEIELLIKDSIKNISNSTELANRSGKALSEISSSIDSVTNFVGEISVASEEQKEGMSQINTAVTEMDTMTQQNASLVEETASASEEMANQAKELLSLVNQFKVDLNSTVGKKITV